MGKNNPLLPICDFPLNNQIHKNYSIIYNNNNDDHILNHALISYNEKNIDFLIFSCDENKWFLSKQNKTQAINIFTNNQIKSVNLINKSSLIDHKLNKTITRTNPIEINEKKNHFANFVLQLIKNKYNTNGHIQSCQPGTKKQSILFYNIGGSFRFCERLQRHHKSNQTCIIIDTLTNRYQIKCKDPDCRDFKPSWRDIPFNEIKNIN